MTEVLKALRRHPFVEGMARSFDLLGTYNRRSIYSVSAPGEADRAAFAGDWEAIGADLRSAMKEIESEAEEHALA
jgi:hypothetical protein